MAETPIPPRGPLLRAAKASDETGEAVPHSAPAVLAPRGRGGAFVRAARPRQWVKNLLVFAAPAAAGTLGHPAVLGRSAAAAGLFLAASSGVYLVNDVADADADRVHPLKRTRPIAAGEISPHRALGVAVVLIASSLLGAAALAGGPLFGVLCAYVAITLSYTFALKHVAVVDLACVASGFVLRAVAGGAAAHLPISPWFLTVTSAGALLLVAGKRTGELRTLGAGVAAHRPVLATYPEPFLRFVRAVAATVTITSYGLWAFDRANHLGDVRPDADDIVVRLSIVPFVIAVLVVELALERGQGGAPEELFLRDRTLQVLGALCVGLVLLGVYT